MRLRNPAPPARSGASMVEGAIVFMTTFLLMVGLVVGALGVSRYQQVAAAAREGARYACCHGGLYARERSSTASSTDDIVRRINAHLPWLGLTASNVEVWFHHIRQDRVSGATEVIRESWDATDRFPWTMISNSG